MSNGHKIIRTFQIARNETVEIRWTDPKTGEVVIDRFNAPPPATWQARIARQAEKKTPTADDAAPS